MNESAAEMSEVTFEPKSTENDSHQQETDEGKEDLKKKLKFLLVVAIVLLILLIVSVGALIGILLGEHFDDSDEERPKVCGEFPGTSSMSRIILEEPDSPDLFHDVTVTEIKRIQQFLKDENILKVKPEDAMLSDATLFTVDLQPPNKNSALDHLDRNADPPPRYGRAILFRGDLQPPVVEERICGPLDNIVSCDVDLTAPFSHRPLTTIEVNSLEDYILPFLQREIGHIIRESFEASLDFANCEDDCLNWWQAQIPTNNYGDNDARLIWVTPTYNYPYMAIFPVDFSFLIDTRGVDSAKYEVQHLWYRGKFYENVQELKDAYASGNITVVKRTYPTKEEANFATMTQRGDPKPREPQRPPQLIEPDGKRYQITHQKVDYLDMWSFHFRMSALYGFSLFDIRFLDERIAYELSLQDLAAVYSGSTPQARQQLFVDSAFSLGGKSKALVPGADCPNTATFVPITITAQEKEEPAVFQRAVCIFEQNRGVPLRRHHSYSQDEGATYGGMLDSALVLRTIHSVDNYDYLVEVTFHQNGAMGASVMLTGYLSANAWEEQERPYGFQLHDYLYGPMHQHLAHFKVDLDVGGSTSNRYEAMEIKEETVTLRGTKPPRPFSQMRYESSVKTTEQEAIYKYDFNTPKLHIVYNNNTRNKYGVQRAYRIVSHSNSKLLIKEGVGPEPAVQWARNQMAVTKRKETEQRSTSYLSQYDTMDKKISFQDFYEDNENILDEDLVVWISLGAYHIPHSEDLPVTSTVAKGESFHLVPYNYFPECPSVASRDAIHVNMKDLEKPEEELEFDFYGTGDVSKSHLGGACIHKPFDMTKLWKEDPDDLFEVYSSHGVF